MNEHLATLEQTRSTLMNLAVAYGPRVVTAALILVAGWFAGGRIGRGLDGVLQRLELVVTLRILLVRIARVLVLLLFAIMALQNLGVELLPLIAGLGIAGAGLGKSNSSLHRMGIPGAVFAPFRVRRCTFLTCGGDFRAKFRT